jgi:hypothetical protein
MPWARDRYACVVFNLHVTHDLQGIDHAARGFRSLIDLAIRYSGSYYLTYHRFRATGTGTTGICSAESPTETRW